MLSSSIENLLDLRNTFFGTDPGPPQEALAQPNNLSGLLLDDYSPHANQTLNLRLLQLQKQAENKVYLTFSGRSVEEYLGYLLNFVATESQEHREVARKSVEGAEQEIAAGVLLGGVEVGGGALASIWDNSHKISQGLEDMKKSLSAVHHDKHEFDESPQKFREVKNFLRRMQASQNKRKKSLIQGSLRINNKKNQQFQAIKADKQKQREQARKQRQQRLAAEQKQRNQRRQHQNKQRQQFKLFLRQYMKKKPLFVANQQRFQKQQNNYVQSLYQQQQQNQNRLRQSFQQIIEHEQKYRQIAEHNRQQRQLQRRLNMASWKKVRLPDDDSAFVKQESKIINKERLRKLQREIKEEFRPVASERKRKELMDLVASSLAKHTQARTSRQYEDIKKMGNQNLSHAKQLKKKVVFIPEPPEKPRYRDYLKEQRKTPSRNVKSVLLNSQVEDADGLEQAKRVISVIHVKNERYLQRIKHEKMDGMKQRLKAEHQQGIIQQAKAKLAILQSINP